MHSFARTPAFRTISLAGQGRGLSPSNDRVLGVKWRVCTDAITISPSVSPEADRSPFADSLQGVAAPATVPSARRRSPHATLRNEMRVTITCEECGERHRLERRVSEPGPIWIVCHNCELPLQAVLDGVASPTTAPAAQPSRTPSAWAGVVDFRAV